MPLPTAAADLAAILSEVGDVVSFGEITAFGCLDESDVLETTDGMQLQTRATTLLIATGALGKVPQNSKLTVAGREYAVRDLSLEGDGATQRLTLARVTSKP